MQDEIPCVVVGNKVDCSEINPLTIEKGKQLAKELNCPFILASAKHKVNVDEVFIQCARAAKNKLFPSVATPNMK
jgi:Fe2+ transport system protein B